MVLRYFLNGFEMVLVSALLLLLSLLFVMVVVVAVAAIVVVVTLVAAAATVVLVVVVVVVVIAVAAVHHHHHYHCHHLHFYTLLQSEQKLQALSCISTQPSVHQYNVTSLHGYSCNFVVGNFTKICHILIWIQIIQK